MKKITLTVAALATLTLTSCGSLGNFGNTGTNSSSTGNILSSILGSATSGETIGNILTSVIGLDKMTANSLIGTWKYQGPGCAFTSENALAKAGGEIAAAEVESKLAEQYSKIGFSSSNTYFTFNPDGTFSTKIDGKSWSGKWTFDEKTQAVTLSGLIINLTCYAKRNGNGISLLFESKKVLTLLQTIASVSGNSALSTIGDISKNYDGVRIGFDLQK